MLRSHFVCRCIGGGSAYASTLHTLHLRNAASGYQILELGPEDLNWSLQLFGRADEGHAPKFIDLLLKLFDLDIAFSKRTTVLDQGGL